MSNPPDTARGRSATSMDEDIDLHRLWGLLVDARWLILGTTVLALLL